MYGHAHDINSCIFSSHPHRITKKSTALYPAISWCLMKGIELDWMCYRSLETMEYIHIAIQCSERTQDHIDTENPERNRDEKLLLPLIHEIMIILYNNDLEGRPSSAGTER